MRRYSVIPSVLPSLRILIFPLLSVFLFFQSDSEFFIVTRNRHCSSSCIHLFQLYFFSLFDFILITPTRLTIQVTVFGPFTPCACSARLNRRVPQLPSLSISSSQLRPPVGRSFLSSERCANRSKFCFPLLIIILGSISLPWLSTRSLSATSPSFTHVTLGAFPGSFLLTRRKSTWTVLAWSV